MSPGRINLIGDHTDYNQGFALPGAIDKTTEFTINKNHTESKVRISDKKGNTNFQFDLNSFKPINGGWQNYIMGVVSELQKLGVTLTGFDATFEGTVPIGRGLSSSASLECSLAFGLNELFDLGLDKSQLVLACQMAEHHFVGIKCGIMDQFVSIMGKKDHVIFLDCQSMDYQYIPFDVQDCQLILCSSEVTHSLATSKYNERREECEKGVGILNTINPNIKTLRDVGYDFLQTHKSHLPTIIYNRCHHVITENQRVLSACQALKDNDLEALGSLMYESHHSLSHDYDVSCQELDFLVEESLKEESALGSRMMGGGFGGCTINLVQRSAVDYLKEKWSRRFEERFGILPITYEVNISDGASVVL